MPRSCLDGYLTPACAACPDWADGSDLERGLGCACHFPIMECPHFAKVVKEDEAREKVYRIVRSSRDPKQFISYTDEGKVIIVTNKVHAGFGKPISWVEKDRCVIAKMENVAHDFYCHYHGIAYNIEDTIPYAEFCEVLRMKGFVPEYECDINQSEKFYVWAHLELGAIITIETWNNGRTYNSVDISLPVREHAWSGTKRMGFSSCFGNIETYNLCFSKKNEPLESVLALAAGDPDWNGETPSLWHYGDQMDSKKDFSRVLRRIYDFRDDVAAKFNMDLEKAFRSYNNLNG